MKPNLEILLATYNGGLYLEQQLDSLLNQTYSNFKILIRDDGSTDNTKEIIKKYQQNYADKIRLIEDKYRGLGPSGNFTELVKYSQADYVMFCDQDDVWREDKIQLTLEKMKEIEKTNGIDTPILVHSDLKIVDSNLNILEESMSKAQKLMSNKSNFSSLLVQNTITGCTVMVNRALLIKSKTIPSNAIMHDWWLGLVASCFGKIGYIDDGLILYRQHGKNDVGAQVFNLKNIFKKINYTGVLKAQKSIANTIIQTNAFINQFNDQLDQHQRLILSEYGTIKDKNKICRIYTLIKYRIYKKGVLRNLMFILMV